MTVNLKDQANALPWGPSIQEPTFVGPALDYAIAIIGLRVGPMSLGEVYAYKKLLWVQQQLHVDKRALRAA